MTVTSTTHFRPRTYLMCPPEHFAVRYAINPWMTAETPVDTGLALKQWARLREEFELLGHTVHILPAVPDLPDMVFAANGAFSVDGTVYGAQFRYPQRAAEAVAHRNWYAAAGWRLVAPNIINEGEGDFTYVPDRRLILAGHGFRSDRASHPEVSAALGCDVVSLQLIDERFYHLDLALFVLDDTNICYFPAAFADESQQALAELFPDAVLATEADAVTFGLNSVSDGLHVVMAPEAASLADRLALHGYKPIVCDLSELKKGGGGVKCCTAELRSS